MILNETFDDCSPADAIAPDGVMNHLSTDRIFTGAQSRPGTSTVHHDDTRISRARTDACSSRQS